VDELPTDGLSRDARGLQQQPMMLARKTLALPNLRPDSVRARPGAAPTPPPSGRLRPAHAEPSTRIPTVVVAGARTPALSVTVHVTR